MKTTILAPVSHAAADVRAYANVIALPASRERASRTFGTGYGRSSGYAATPRYVSDTGLSRFRCA